MAKTLKITKKSTPLTIDAVATPTQLTHYTDLHGLKGIVQNKELWLSNASFLNDPEEINHGIAMARKVLKTISKDISDSDVVAKARKKLVDQIAKEIETFNPPEAYIVCFCEQKDLLSQWRGYSSHQGISISFDTKKLMQAFQGSNIDLQKVHYGVNATRDHLMNHIQENLPDIADDIEYMIGSLTSVEIKKAFFDLMSKLAPRFKHFGFREEKEWRLIVTNPEKQDILFRPRSQLMLPYVAISSPDNLLPITRVTIGPGIQDTAVSNSIRFFLEKVGYDPDLVCSSRTPYRS